MPPSTPIRRALISVSDKSHLIKLAKQLIQLNIEILASDGTAKFLLDANIPCIKISAHTGHPEILDGRVKTLHPKIHAGLLARPDKDAADIKQHEISLIQLVIINLYPFSETIAKPDCKVIDAIEQIDVGGPSMLRSASKNFLHVTTITDPNDYPKLLRELQSNKTQSTSYSFRQTMACKAFHLLAQYNLHIANYFDEMENREQQIQDKPKQSASIPLPDNMQLSLQLHQELRYGENPQQQAALYHTGTSLQGSLSQAKLLQGKPLSYNNLVDANAAYRCVSQFSNNEPCCCIIKHATPCGIAAANNQLQAYQKALQTDPLSAFGGIISFNTPLEAITCEHLLKKQFAEVIIAPSIHKEALHLLATKPQLRVLETGTPCAPKEPQLQITSIDGGILIQEQDITTWPPANLQHVTGPEPDSAQWQEIAFAWLAVSCIKSNAIVFTKDKTTLGIGTGQTSRVFSAQIAILKAEQAQLCLKNSFMASDAFLPFPDTLDIAARAGANWIIQPGGSKRDPEIIASAKEAGVTLIFTGVRHFLH